MATDFDNPKNAAGRAKKHRSGRKSAKRTRAITGIVLAVCCAAIVFSVGMIVLNSKNESSDRDRVTSDFSVFINPTPEAEDKYPGVDFPVGILENMKSFYARNPETVGFVMIGGIDGFGYPVVQTDNNEKYYRRDLDLNKSREGTAFVDCRVDLTSPASNILIHGHNNKNGLMFGPIEKYNALLHGLDQYLKAPTLTYYSLFEKTEYKIVTLVIANTHSKDGPRFDFSKTDLSTPEAFEEFKNEVEKRATFTTGADLQFGDRIITLHTCSYYGFEGSRVLLIARALRDGESPETDVSAAKTNFGAAVPDTFAEKKKLGVRASEVFPAES